MRDEQKASFFRDILNTDAFQAQTALEDETYQSLLSKLLTLDLKQTDVSIEYAKIRGSLEVLQGIKAKRAHLVEQARTRNSNS